MKYEIILCIVLVVIIIVILRKYITITKRIRYIEDILSKVLDGNNNLHIFCFEKDSSERISLLINQLMDSYQNERIILQREEKSRKQLLANISHDIRTPLSSVIGYIEAIKLDILSQHEKKAYLQIALDKSYDLKQKLEQLFELVRLDANEIQFKMEKVEVCELIRGVVIDFIPIVEKENIQMEINIPEEEYYVWADEQALIRVVQNLIRNALTHGKLGFYIGIKVFIENGAINVDVIDHGEGIRKNDLDFVFDRLYQGDSSRTKNGGLGLAIAYELMKKVNGNITVRSEKFKYTIFNISIPLLE